MIWQLFCNGCCWLLFCFHCFGLDITDSPQTQTHMNNITEYWILDVTINSIFSAVFQLNLGYPVPLQFYFRICSRAECLGLSGTGCYRPDALPVTEPTVLKQWSEVRALTQPREINQPLTSTFLQRLLESKGKRLSFLYASSPCHYHQTESTQENAKPH